MSLRFHIDFPARFALPSHNLRMSGWAFIPGQRLQGVRLLLPGRALSGDYGTDRPDVSAIHSDAPGREIGFEIRGRVSPGPNPARLEFQDERGQWQLAASFDLTASRWPRPHWLPGGNPAELLAFQLAAHASHAPRPILPEKYPESGRGVPAPRLTIVTPSFQQRNFLGETISSVLDQPGAAVDYLVQDGGSTDGSVELIRSYSNRLKGWQTAPDGGQTDAIAHAFEQTTGQPTDVMAWINSDDFYLPGALAYVADFFAREPAVDVIYSHRILVDENSQEVGRWFLPRHDPDVLGLYDFVPQETLFWRRRIWDKVGGLDRSFQFAMDWDLFLRFQKAGAHIVRVPRFLAGFRLHPAQKTAAGLRSIGQPEIDRLRARTFGRDLSATEIENYPPLISYLRKSAWLEFAHRFGYRGQTG